MDDMEVWYQFCSVSARGISVLFLLVMNISVTDCLYFFC